MWEAPWVKTTVQRNGRWVIFSVSRCIFFLFGRQVWDAIVIINSCCWYVHKECSTNKIILYPTHWWFKCRKFWQIIPKNPNIGNNRTLNMLKPPWSHAVVLACCYAGRPLLHHYDSGHWHQGLWAVVQKSTIRLPRESREATSLPCFECNGEGIDCSWGWPTFLCTAVWGYRTWLRSCVFSCFSFSCLFEDQ